MIEITEEIIEVKHERKSQKLIRFDSETKTKKIQRKKLHFDYVHEMETYYALMQQGVEVCHHQNRNQIIEKDGKRYLLENGVVKMIEVPRKLKLRERMIRPRGLLD